MQCRCHILSLLFLSMCCGSMHVVQLSHWMQGDLVVTALLHTPQGRTGPGLEDTSPQRMISTS